MHVFTVVGDPVRRRILERLIEEPLSSGDIVDSVGDEFGITQSAISQQLKVLRDCGFAKVAARGNHRIYSLDPTGFEQMDEWLAPFRSFWGPKFNALAKEVERGKRRKKKQLP